MKNIMHDPLSIMGIMVPVLIGLGYILLVSLFKEPDRQKFNAIMVAGAGAAYLNGGLMGWEFIFCSVMTFLAFKGLKRYVWLGIAWILHTGWDLMHHYYGNPIVPMDVQSSLGCAICDPVIAVWLFIGAPRLFPFSNRRAVQ